MLLWQACCSASSSSCLDCASIVPFYKLQCCILCVTLVITFEKGQGILTFPLWKGALALMAFHVTQGMEVYKIIHGRREMYGDIHSLLLWE